MKCSSSKETKNKGEKRIIQKRIGGIRYQTIEERKQNEKLSSGI